MVELGESGGGGRRRGKYNDCTTRMTGYVRCIHTHLYIYICSNLYLLVLLSSWFLLLSLYFISIIIHSVKTENI